MSSNIVEKCLKSINKAKNFSHINALITNTFDLAIEQAKECQPSIISFKKML